MIYKWKPEARVLKDIDPQVVGTRLEKIRTKHSGQLTPKLVVKDARPATSPLHPLFEWNDSTAAEKYREDQARFVLRSITVILDEQDPDAKPTRAFVVVREEKEQYYDSIEVVLNDEEKRRQVIARALRELEQWRARYQEYAELAEIFEAIDRRETIAAD